MPSRSQDADPPFLTPGEDDPDKSMETILASIRRIISEEEPAAPAHPPETDDDALVLLQDSMIVQPASAAPVTATPVVVTPAPVVVAAAAPSPSVGSSPSPPNADEPLLAPEARLAAARSLDSLHEALQPPSPPVAESGLAVFRSGGPSLEDLVRDELRGQLKQWLDTHLPEMVERLVRAEIERVVRRN